MYRKAAASILMGAVGRKPRVEWKLKMRSHLFPELSLRKQHPEISSHPVSLCCHAPLHDLTFNISIFFFFFFSRVLFHASQHFSRSSGSAMNCQYIKDVFPVHQDHERLLSTLSSKSRATATGIENQATTFF